MSNKEFVQDDKSFHIVTALLSIIIYLLYN